MGNKCLIGERTHDELKKWVPFDHGTEWEWTEINPKNLSFSAKEYLTKLQAKQAEFQETTSFHTWMLTWNEKATLSNEFVQKAATNSASFEWVLRTYRGRIVPATRRKT